MVDRLDLGPSEFISCGFKSLYSQFFKFNFFKLGFIASVFFFIRSLFFSKGLLPEFITRGPFLRFFLLHPKIFYFL